MVAAVLVELERHDRDPGAGQGERGALLRHSAPQHQPTDPCTTLAGSAERTRSNNRPSGGEGAQNESSRKPSKPSPHWAAFLSAAVFGRRVLSRTSAFSSSVSLEVSMARLGSATSSRTTVTRR